jgi:hypothetical protein
MKRCQLRLFRIRLSFACLCLTLTLNGQLSAFAGNQSPNTLRRPQAANTYLSSVSALQGPPSFTDVPNTHPFYTEITNIAARGITSGCGGGNYCPDATITRAQMAVFILRALGVFNPPQPAQQRFADVLPTHPFYAFIDQMAALGITQGCGGGNYCPDAAVSREQMAAFIMRAIGIFAPPTPAVQRFTDVPPTHPFYGFIDQMAVRGITSGCGIGLYCPTLTVTRAAMAAFLVRGFGLTDPGAPGGSLANVNRFLYQATWGPTTALEQHVQNIGISAYLDEQFAAPISGYPELPLMPTTQTTDCQNNIPANCIRDNYTMYLLQRRLFENAFYQPDQLRQRVAWALHKIIVVSGRGVDQPSWMAYYLRILDQQAFGNFRQLLYDITLNPGMGRYLDLMTSTRTNPNENYAREILQLFSIGLDVLNPDGTPQLNAQGETIPTYDQAVVDGFTKALTGWRLATQVAPGVPNYRDPMVLITNNHDNGSKLLLNGFVQPANQGGVLDLNAALDNIFNHPNVGPFISKLLIHDLVTSNPSPAYVGRVAAVFNNNGASVRGDLRAVVRAILLDPEARGGGYGYGHLKEPAQLICNVARAFNVRSFNGSGNSDGYVYPQSTNMDQDVLRPLTVFSYYPADYVVPGYSTLLGPEFGILSTASSLRRANFVNTIVFSGINTSTNAPNGTSLDLSGLQALAGTPSALVDEVNRILMYNTMSAEMRNSIITAVTAVSSSNPTKRARTAVYLVATSAQYQVQR